MTTAAEAQIVEREVEVGGTRVRYRVAGAGDPLILVHGLAGSARWWRPSLPAFAARHRVYLVDLPGFGTLRRLAASFVLAEAAGWLGEWMEAAGLRRADVVGHSMGGAICVRLAASRPDSVRRLVLVAPSGLMMRRSLVANVVPLVRSLGRTTPRFLSALTRDALRAGPRVVWRAARQIVDEDLRDELPRITAPTLLVFGQQDALVPPAVAHVFRSAIRGSRLLVLERAAHVPMFDRPEVFESAVLAFLAGERVGE